MTDRPTCKLIGTDGNAFALIGVVKKCLVENGKDDQAERFAAEAMDECNSYDELLCLIMKYVDVI